MLKNIFIALATTYSNYPLLTKKLWEEIEKAYSGTKRHYHNQKHLQNMYGELLEVKQLTEDWDTILFSLFYHDIVYKATAKDNEEKSAVIAIKCLQIIHYPIEKIVKCRNQILSTQHHNTINDNDTNLLLDADMAILGSDWHDYEIYYKAVRKEYTIYPDFLYNPGRAKVLNHFLSMDHIFSTGHFREKYEKTARTNLKKELEYLI